MNCIIKKLTAVVTALTMLAVFVPTFSAVASGNVNLLENVTILTASQTSGSGSTKAVNMFDGDDSTYFQTWSSATEGTYVLDLGEEKAFNRFVVLKPTSPKRDHSISFYVSDNNSDWTDVITGAVVPEWSGVEIPFDIADTTARYVKIVIHDIIPANGYYGFAVSEFKLFNTDDSDANILKNAPVIQTTTAKGVSNSYHVQMFDGNVQTAYVVGSVTEASYTVDAGEVSVFNTLKLIKGTKYPETFDLLVEGSENNSEWDILYEIQNVEGGAQEEQEYFLGDKSARYIRFVFSNTQNKRIDIAELQLLNLDDTKPPVITLEGESNMELELGEGYIEPGYTAWDNRDGDITGSVSVSGDEVDVNTRGIYTITYTVYDNAGNKGEASRTIGVGIDTIPPVITLIGGDEIVVGLGDTYTDPGYIAEDNFDGIITDDVVVSGDEVDVNTVGTYIVKYDVQDSSGNIADTIERKVRVVEYEYGINICPDAELVGGSVRGGENTYTANIFDGDVTTRFRPWVTVGITDDFVLNFGEAKLFNQLVIIQGESNVRYFTLTFYVGDSENGPWTAVAEPVYVAPNAGESTVVNFDTQSAKYVRFYIDNVDSSANFYNLAELQLCMDRESYVVSADLVEINLPSKTGVDIELAETGSYGSEISWTSSAPEIMADNGQIVLRPAYGEEAKSLTLTAEFTYGKISAKKVYDIIVTPKNPAENAVVSAGAESVCDADYTTTYEVSDKTETEFEFANEELVGCAVLETASNSRITDVKVYAWEKSGYSLLESEYDSQSLQVKFTAGVYEKLMLSFEGNGVTNVAELIFGVTDEDAVDYLAENLTISEEASNKITKDLILIKKGDHGQKVTWESSDTSVILDNGTVFRGSKNEYVTITATITKGEAERKVEFDVTVLKDSSSKSSGGGGGGGSKGGGVTVPFTEPPKSEITPEPKPAGILGMNNSHWAYAYVEKLANAGVVSGNQNGDFEPEKNVTRAEFVKMLVAAFGIEINQNAQPFDDVSPDAWYAPYINSARSIGIITGDNKNFANPDELISRQDMAVMLGRAAEICNKTTSPVREYAEFTDGAYISEYALSHIRTLYSAGVIDGMTNGSFEPLSSATKAQAAKLIASMM